MLDTITHVVTLLLLAGAAAVFLTYLVLEIRAAFWSCPADDEPPADLPDAEGEALPGRNLALEVLLGMPFEDLEAPAAHAASPAPYTTGALRLVDLAGADAAGIEPRGCWGTVSRGGALVDCGQEVVDDVVGLCRVHAEALQAIQEAGA